jgi:hypothetical protein
MTPGRCPEYFYLVLYCSSEHKDNVFLYFIALHCFMVCSALARSCGSNSTICDSCFGLREPEEPAMAKGQIKRNKEAKKPKADAKAKGPGSSYKQSQGKTGSAVDSSGRKA